MENPPATFAQLVQVTSLLADRLEVPTWGGAVESDAEAQTLMAEVLDFLQSLHSPTTVEGLTPGTTQLQVMAGSTAAPDPERVGLVQFFVHRAEKLDEQAQALLVRLADEGAAQTPAPQPPVVEDAPADGPVDQLAGRTKPAAVAEGKGMGTGTLSRINTLLIVLALAALVGTRMEEADVEVLVEERLVSEGLVLSKEVLAARAAEAATWPPWRQSVAFLAQLDELMASYVSVPPEPIGGQNLLRCVTDYELSVDDELSRGAKPLLDQVDVSAGAWAKGVRDAVSYRIDYGWPERGTQARAHWSCWIRLREVFVDGSTVGSWRWHWDDSVPKAQCGWRTEVFIHGFVVRKEQEARWKLRRPEGDFIYTYSSSTQPPTQPPPLMVRMEAAGVAVPDRFSCQVLNQEDGFVVCIGGQLSGTLLRISGEAPVLHRGDIVSVPLRDVPGGSKGVLFKARRTSSSEMVWMVEVDGAEVRIDEAATCPSTAEIVAAASVEKGL